VCACTGPALRAVAALSLFSSADGTSLPPSSRRPRCRPTDVIAASNLLAHRRHAGAARGLRADAAAGIHVKVQRDRSFRDVGSWPHHACRETSRSLRLAVAAGLRRHDGGDTTRPACVPGRSTGGKARARRAGVTCFERSETARWRCWQCPWTRSRVAVSRRSPLPGNAAVRVGFGIQQPKWANRDVGFRLRSSAGVARRDTVVSGCRPAPA
jgi:hypothetical protein